MKNRQIKIALALSHQMWQHLANSSTNPHLTNQLQSHGFEPSLPSGNDVFDWLSVDSSCISAIGYDGVYSTLRIRFNSGAVYEYEGFQHSEFRVFRDAPSLGRYFNSHIRDHYHYTIIDD